MSNFVNLHVHSTKSLLDGMVKIDDLIEKTLSMNQIASCITDHGNLYTIVDHFKEADKKGQKPIAGFEAYIVDDHTQKGKSESDSSVITKRNHFLLLARNQSGYQKLCRICSKGYTDGFYYRPRIDNGILEEFIGNEKDDLIATSACLAGKIPQFIMSGDLESARKEILYYQDLFHGHFYLEIQPTELLEQFIVNKALIDFSKELSVPIIATTDAHYLNKEDKETHDVLLCLQSKCSISDPNRWSFAGNTYYVMSKEEILNSFTKSFNYKKILMKDTRKNATSEYREKYIYDYDRELFLNPEKLDGFKEIVSEGGFDYKDLDQNVIRQSVAETEEIVNQCNVHFGFDKHYLPKINIPTEDAGFKKWRNRLKNKKKDNEDYLKYLCIKSLVSKGLTSQVYRDRLEFELKVIDDMDFPDYFLIYYDIAKFCHEQKVALGPGRGCFKGNNKVLTNHGYENIKDVSIGDFVYCHDELKHEVVGKHEYEISEPVVGIDCGDSYIDGATLDHKVLAIKQKDFDKGVRNPQWYRINDLNEGDYICEGES